MARKKPTRKPSRPQSLRERAEELLRAKPAEMPTLPTGDVQALVHELSVHQMELEIQNEELRQAQVELAHSRDRYADLYEFAPVGYVTLNREGRILEANLTVATMLGVERQTLLQSNLSAFVDHEAQDDFYLYRQAVFAMEDIADHAVGNGSTDGERQICELEMHKADGTPLVLRLKSIPFGDVSDLQCLTALIDVTRRRQAERALQNLNETLEQRVTNQIQEIHLLAEAVAHLGEGVVITEDELDWPGPRIVFVNEAMCRITGYASDELIGQSPRILQGKETDRATLDRLKSLLACNRPCEVELVNYRKDGTPYDAELLITPLFNAAGKRTNFVSIHRDVTEKKQAAQALQEQEAFVRSVFASPVANIAVLDGEGRIRAVNAAWQRFAQENGGSTLIQSSVGVDYLDICRAAVESGDELAGEALRGLQDVMDGTTMVFSLEYPCHGPSEERWFQMTVTPAHLEHGGVVVAHLPITERKQAEESLRREHELSERIIDTAQNVVLLLGSDGRIIRFNPYMERLSGWQLDEVRGHDWFDTFLPQRDRERIRGLFGRALGGERTRGNVNAIITRDGREREIEWHDAPLTSPEGELIGLLCIGHDITEWKQAEQAVRVSEQRLRWALEGAGGGAWDWDLVRDEIWMSPEMYELWGIDPDTPMHLENALAMMYEQDREPMRRLVEESIARHRDLDYEFRIRHPLRGERWMVCYGRIVSDASGRAVRMHGITLDITARKEAEEALRHEHALSEGIINTAEHIILLLDTDGRILRFNPYLERLSGWMLAEVRGRDWFDTFLPERARDRVRDVFARALTGERTRANVDVMVTKDGRTLDVEWFDTPLTSADGELVGLLCTGQDVTEQRRAAEALRESEQRFRAIFDHAATGIAITDWEGRYVMSNPAYCEIVGYDDAELRSLVFPTLIHPDDLEENLDLIEQLKSAEIPSFRIENRYVRKDGNAVWVRKFVSILRDDAGQPTHLIALVRDVTDEKRTQDILRDREERMRAVLNTAADAIITIDEKGVIEGVNPATEQMFGYAEDELLGRNVRVLMPANFRNEDDDYISRFLKTGEARIIGSGREVTGRRKDGSTFPVDLSVSRIEHLGLFTGIIRDISERKALQQHLLEIAADQQRRIGQDLHDDVGQELVALGMTAGTLTQAVEGLCTDEESGEVLRMSRKLADGLRECLQKVRFLSRGLVPVEVDAEGLATALHDLAAQIGQLHHVNCTFDSPTAIPINDNTTATHLYRIAQEAVTNALKHGQPREIRISLAERNGLIVLEVADDGVGVPQPVPLENGTGLRTMNYRAGLIGARLDVRPRDEGGTLVSCVLNQY